MCFGITASCMFVQYRETVCVQPLSVGYSITWIIWRKYNDWFPLPQALVDYRVCGPVVHKLNLLLLCIQTASIKIWSLVRIMEDELQFLSPQRSQMKKTVFSENSKYSHMTSLNCQFAQHNSCQFADSYFLGALSHFQWLREGGGGEQSLHIISVIFSQSG